MGVFFLTWPVVVSDVVDSLSLLFLFVSCSCSSLLCSTCATQIVCHRIVGGVNSGLVWRHLKRFLGVCTTHNHSCEEAFNVFGNAIGAIMLQCAL